MPTLIGVRLAKVGPPLPLPSARAAAEAAAASEEAPAICRIVRRVMSVGIAGLVAFDQSGPVYHVLAPVKPAMPRHAITCSSSFLARKGGGRLNASAIHCGVSEDSMKPRVLPIIAVLIVSWPAFAQEMQQPTPRHTSLMVAGDPAGEQCRRIDPQNTLLTTV